MSAIEQQKISREDLEHKFVELQENIDVAASSAKDLGKKVGIAALIVILIIAFILGPGAERALRQALLLSQDGAMIFLERPMAVFFILLAVLVIGVRIYQTVKQDSAGKRAPVPE